MIEKQGDKYVVKSEKTGRTFGSYDVIAAAKRRLAQIEAWKHMKGGKQKP